MRCLEAVANVFPQLDWVVALIAFPFVNELSAGRPDQVAAQLQQRTFSTPRRPDDRHEVALFNGEGYVRNNFFVFSAKRDVSQFQHRQPIHLHTLLVSFKQFVVTDVFYQFFK